MVGFESDISLRWYDNHVILAQQKMDFKVFTPTSIDFWTLLVGVFVVAVTVVCLVIATNQYQRWKRYSAFVSEMKTLGLESDCESILMDLVNRYSLTEPVNILFSPRLYDEVASSEVMRVLSSQASIHNKEKYINQLYDIRIKTYHGDWK